LKQDRAMVDINNHNLTTNICFVIKFDYICAIIEFMLFELLRFFEIALGWRGLPAGQGGLLAYKIPIDTRGRGYKYR
jgi:hypothetical protein